MALTFTMLFHTIVDYFFKILIVFMFVRIILTWIQLGPGNPFMRFFSNIVDPIINPVARRLPHVGVGAFDIGYTVAFIFTFWALLQIDGYILYAMPANW